MDIKEENVNNEQFTQGMVAKLIFIRVYKMLSKNPNLYAAILGIIWALISYRWNIKMPSIVHESIAVISKTGLGLVMFNLGISMAFQPKIIACGKTQAAIAMVLKFVVAPLLFAATSAAVGIRGVLFKFAIVQASLPVGIFPAVFAKVYGLHPEIFNTSVIFGLVICLPITILYFVILEFDTSF